MGTSDEVEALSNIDAAVFETEKRALVLDRSSVLLVVSALRRYRQAAARLLSSSREKMAVLNFEHEVDEIGACFVEDDHAD